jgi:hypothetical protein
MIKIYRLTNTRLLCLFSSLAPLSAPWRRSCTILKSAGRWVNCRSRRGVFLGEKLDSLCPNRIDPRTANQCARLRTLLAPTEKSSYDVAMTSYTVMLEPFSDYGSMIMALRKPLLRQYKEASDRVKEMVTNHSMEARLYRRPRRILHLAPLSLHESMSY